jgi:hypothetical protein
MIRGKIILLSLGLVLSACVSFDPYELQKTRLNCNEEYPSGQSSIVGYYSCVQERAAFGAYSKNKRQNKAKPTAIKAQDEFFERDINFINQEVPEEDAPWLMMELAVRAMAQGKIDFAHTLLESTTGKIETIYGDSAQAKQARRTFSQEAEKLFIGENHERAMVFHYLGLADLMRGDYQNARASFAAALLQDSIAGKEEYKKDFSSALWLQGWASRCAGSRQARSLFKQASALTNTPPPPLEDNLLVLAEMGKGPFKLVQGKYGEKLSYGALTPTPLEQNFQPSAYNLYVVNDLFFQATTRGDRSFDDYLADKAETKKTASEVSRNALITGVALLDVASRMDSEAAGVVALVGVAALAAGGIAHAIAVAANPMADIRTFRSLPDSIYVGSFNTNKSRNLKNLKSKNQKLTRLINNVKKNQAAGKVAAVYVNPKGGKCSILWIKDISNG